MRFLTAHSVTSGLFIFDQILQFTTMLTLTKKRTLVRLLLIAEQDHLADYRKLPLMPGEQRVSLWLLVIDCHLAVIEIIDSGLLVL